MARVVHPNGTAAAAGLILASVAVVVAGAETRSSSRYRATGGQQSIRRAAQAVATSPKRVVTPKLEVVEEGVEIWDQQGSEVEPAYGPYDYTPHPNGWTYWGGAEFLLLWHSAADTPALVTTSSPETPSDQAGILGQPTTSILYGGPISSTSAHVGGRITVGVWFDPGQQSGIGLRFFAVNGGSNDFRATSDEVPVLARPFYNLTKDVQDADVVAYPKPPKQTTGAIGIENSSDIVGGDVFWRRLIFAGSFHRTDLLLGYQAAQLDQDLRIGSTRTVVQDPTITTGTVVDSFDSFSVANRYNAFAIGLISEYDQGPIIWRLLAKVGLGNMRQRVSIAGGTARSLPPQAPTLLPEGLLARPSNIGSYEQTVFSASPEVAVSAAYRLTHGVALTAGYSLIYYNHVVEAGNQIDPVIDTRPAGTRPAFSFSDSGYLLHGLTIGLRWEY